MKIAVAASDQQWVDLTGSRTNINWHRVHKADEFHQHKTADAFFSLTDNSILPEFASLNKPVFIGAVADTLADLNAPPNVYRINGWVTFLNRSVWEIAGNINENIKSIFTSLNIKIKTVQDEPGFITARIITMVINEAFMTFEDHVSTKNEIDTAMKLGTNYPYGPFEWAELIGKNNILALLQKLYTTDARYRPALLLINEVKENNQ
jgi:3-hydroxybutyryl-CoA dehydrogenase